MANLTSFSSLNMIATASVPSFFKYYCYLQRNEDSEGNLWNLFFFFPPVRKSKIDSTFFLKYLQGEFLKNYAKFVGLW